MRLAKQFIEKDSVTAESMIKAGTYLWNAGILFKAADMITAFETLAPDNFS